MINPKISIVMPVLNRADMIEKAILSVINQQYPDFELIILDGGSRDNTVEIIRKYEKHVTYWHSKPDGSAAVASNIGIEKASGDLVALLMSDDYYEPGLFHRIAEAYIAHPEADMFTCAGRILDSDGKTIALYNSARELEPGFYNICYGATAICFRFIRKSLHNRIGLYIPFHSDQKQMLTNDKEFLLRAVLHNAKNVFVPCLGYTHVAHAGSYSFGNHRMSFERHCREHMDIAMQYLSLSELALKHKLFFIVWYNDQLARLFLFQAARRNFTGAIRLAKHGLGKYFFIWPAVCFITGLRMVVKKGMRLLNI